MTVESAKPRVIVVGGGFGGLAAARALARAPVEVLLVDRQNHHCFQPLLYQVATAALSPADIAWPIRSILSGQTNLRVVMAKVTGVDTKARIVHADGHDFPYDFLVLASGVTHAYFGHDEWSEVAPGLKQLEDARDIRARFLMAFEKAEIADDEAERRRLLTFVIVGGGPTGVEMAGAVAELARKALAADFRKIDPRRTRVLLLEAGPRLLPTFPEPLSRYTEAALCRLGVEVHLGKPVTRCGAEGVSLGQEFIAAGTIVWAAGVSASPAAKWLDVAGDRAGRVPVTKDLRAPGQKRVFVIGDTALVLNPDGRPVPGIAPAAKQQGAFVARWLRAELAGRATPVSFAYADRGLLATIGRKAAVISYHRLRLKGRIAWWLWGAAHIYLLVNLRNRIIVMTQWLWAYFVFERGARLITGSKPP